MNVTQAKRTKFRRKDIKFRKVQSNDKYIRTSTYIYLFLYLKNYVS